MNKFNLTMVVAIVVAIVFFGFGIIQKANYKVGAGDTVSVSYSIIDGENTYDSQSATVVVGDNTNEIITDDVVSGLKYGSDINFDTTLKSDVVIDDSTTVKSGTKVTIDGKLSDVTPVSTDETASDVTSETVSE